MVVKYSGKFFLMLGGDVMIKIFLIALMLTLLSGIDAAEAEEKVLRVGYMPDTGFVEENWPGHYQGYGYEYMEFLSNYGNWKFNYIPCKSWMEMGRKLNNGEIDLMPEMPGNRKLIEHAIRTDHVIGRFPMELILSTKLEGLPKPHMKLGTLPTNYPTPSLAKIAASEGFKYDLINYTTRPSLRQALLNDEIDGYIDAMLDPEGSTGDIFALFDRQSYRILVRETDTELLAELNVAMDQMLTDQPNIRDRLNLKYLRANGFPLILNRAERDYLSQKEKLVAAVLTDERPFAYYEDDQLKGAIPDIVKKIGEDLNVEVEIIEANSLSEVAEILQNGKADFLADAICDYSWAESFNMSPTQSYLSIDYVPVTRQDFEEKPKVVACVKNALVTKSYIAPEYPEENRVYVEDLYEGFHAVSDGRADVVFAPRAAVPYMIATTDSYNLETGAASYFSDNLSLGVYRYAAPELWHVLNKEINHLDVDWVRSAVAANQQSVVHFTPQWFIYHHPIASMLTLTCIGLIISGVFWYRNRMRKRHLEIVQHMAYTDARYELPNLPWLESQMPLLTERAKSAPSNQKIYAVVFSMQTRATVVERYGDKLLIKQLRDMAEQMRQKDWVYCTAAGLDAGHLICICRADGEEQIKQFVGEAIEQYSYIETTDARIWLHMHAGICEFNLNELTVRQAVERANTACHQPSKADIRIYDEAMQENLMLQHRIETTMEKALESGEFRAYYQPKYDIRTRRIIGAEALIRWISPEMGFMPPGKFIPLFEKNGFVISADYEILEQAFQLQKQRLVEGKEIVPISVNQSRLHMTEEGYLDKLKAIIDKYGISPKGTIELELTETVFGDFDQKENQQRAANIVNALKDMGFTISVDDFGSGYSSFMLLNYLPMDVMKIDRSLLNAAGGAKRTQDILATVINLGKTLNMQIICEGIETPEQEQLLLKLGCVYGQGFLNAKPMPLKDFVEFMEKRNAEVAVRGA